MFEIRKELLSLNQDIAGQAIGIPVYRISNSTKQNDRTVYIQSAVHAAEMQGSAVILELISQLRGCQINADFVLVPNCNPFGRTQRAGEYLQGRFDATNGNNWNRFYHYNEQDIVDFFQALDLTRYENRSSNSLTETKVVSQFRHYLGQKLDQASKGEWGINTAQFLNITLQKLAVTADLVLDLHTGPSSTRHIYSPEFLVEKSKLFNIENIISIPTTFAGALDEASFSPSVKLGRLFEQADLTFEYRTEAYTIELGSQENICLAQAEHDAKGILNYLQANGYIQDGPSISVEEPVVTLLANYRTLFSQHAGMVEYLVKPGDKVIKGQILARVLNSLEFDSDLAIQDILAPVNGTVILHYPSAAVQVGTQLYKIACS